MCPWSSRFGWCLAERWGLQLWAHAFLQPYYTHFWVILPYITSWQPMGMVNSRIYSDRTRCCRWNDLPIRRGTRWVIRQCGKFVSWCKHGLSDAGERLSTDVVSKPLIDVICVWDLCPERKKDRSMWVESSKENCVISTSWVVELISTLVLLRPDQESGVRAWKCSAQRS